ncbi:MAG: hypothetical protein UY04_C0023G0009 [Parcubacteria group bacterium GW2011_GWA2_47_7]|nr:MAG: hypothetical protein UY04_C0023G0009 [Parcubacteria group bacterium GW2011_GWA2_47_7]
MQNIFKISNGDLKKRVLTVLMGISLLLQGGGSPLIAYAFVNPFAIINATKIICDSETMLPNWGLGGPDISANTATDYIASHSGCHLASGWEFQWGYAGVRDLSGDFVGIADGSKGPGTQTGTGGDEWKTFGPSSPNGVAVADVLLKSETDIILVREVAQDGYIPFKYDPAHQSNANAVSAEMYCNNDVLNYDNYDKIISPQVRNTYYCIAFNALKTDIPPNNQKPVISVVGTNPAEVILGSTYVDQGATVFDSEDGQINSKLVTSGSVDVNTLGVYTITYNATDTANLSADTKTRTVTVVSTPVCLAPVDLMLVIDRSGSMKFDGTNPEQPLKQAFYRETFSRVLLPMMEQILVLQ